MGQRLKDSDSNHPFYVSSIALHLNRNVCFPSAALGGSAQARLLLSPLHAACPRGFPAPVRCPPSSWQTPTGSAGPSRPMEVLGPVQRRPLLLGMCRNPRRRKHLVPGACRPV